MYLSLLILNLFFRIILESPQSGESSKPSHFKGSKWHENPLVLFELGVSFAVLNYIYLSFMQIHATFYFNYINYSCLLIFCCQNVATQFYNKIIAISFLLSHLLFPPPFLELYFLLLYLLVKGYNQ